MHIGLIGAAVLHSTWASQVPSMRHSMVSRTEIVQSAEVGCSSGNRFAATATWRPGRGLSLTRAAVNGRDLPKRELEKVAKLTSSATDLQFLRIWCSGDRDGGVEIAYVEQASTGFRPMALALRFTSVELVPSLPTERPSP